MECKVLEVRDVDVSLSWCGMFSESSSCWLRSDCLSPFSQVVLAKLLDAGPVLVLTFQAQQLTSRKGKEGEVEDVSCLRQLVFLLGRAL